jgi:hypothetical protein
MFRISIKYPYSPRYNKARYEGKYWLITTGGKPDFSTKLWPFERWQEVVNKLSWITFVQIGDSKHNHPRLTGKNVIDFIGKTEDEETGFRDLFNLFKYCEGSLGIVSLQMHLAAAFYKPCVTIAGAREPSQWETYPSHRYLHNQGAMKCIKGGGTQQGGSLEDSCWRAKIEACTNTVDVNNTKICKCIDMIKVEDVVKAVETYYEGGRLARPEKGAVFIAKTKPVFRMVCNAHAYIGGERSAVLIIKMMRERGYEIELVPTKTVCHEFRNAAGGIKVTKKLSSPCDILMFYTNDTVWNFDKEEYDIFGKVQAERKFMALNFRMGKAGTGDKAEWTKHWDGYFFLNNTIKDQFLKRVPEAKTFVYAPPVELEPFLAIQPVYNKTLHIIRHSSQGDSKFPKDLNETLTKIIESYPSISFSFMPYPSFLNENAHVKRYSVNEVPVPQYLATGNCFWYMLPPGYQDMGPRVIVEAMAAGLPVIADNRDGAKDRITEETGWLCNSVEDYLNIIKELKHLILEEKGKAAKERAREVFDPQNWITAMLGG